MAAHATAARHSMGWESGWVGGWRVGVLWVVQNAGTHPPCLSLPHSLHHTHFASGVRHEGAKHGVCGRNKKKTSRIVTQHKKKRFHPLTPMARRACTALALATALVLIPPAQAQLSRPVASDADSDAHAARSRFAWRAALDDAGAAPLTGGWFGCGVLVSLRH